MMAAANTSSEPCAKLGTFTETLPNSHNCFQKKMYFPSLAGDKSKAQRDWETCPGPPGPVPTAPPASECAREQFCVETATAQGMFPKGFQFSVGVRSRRQPCSGAAHVQGGPPHGAQTKRPRHTVRRLGPRSGRSVGRRLAGAHAFRLPSSSLKNHPPSF